MRQARKISNSGYYHVVTKGEGDKDLFFDDTDRLAYVSILGEVCEQSKISLIAYCLMSNHVHLLIDDPERHLSEGMKQLNERYAILFKRKSGRPGHVFKNRYWSEPVESESYLLCAMRYIHANPAAAGICKASAYQWSSVQDYLGRRGTDGIASTGLILDMLGGREGFISFCTTEPPTALPFPTSRLRNHLSLSELRRIAVQLVGEPEDVKNLSQESQRSLAQKLASAGFTKKQIELLTGLSASRVRTLLPTQKSA